MSRIRLIIAAASILALTGCVVAPAPYPAYGAGYGYGYPGYGYPGYVAGPTVEVGVGGWGRGGGWHR
jgi:hypothetical protein